VKKLRSTHVSPKAPAPEAPRPALEARPTPAAPAPGGFVSRWVRFWFTPADPVGLHGVRLLAGLLFLFFLLTLAGQEESLFGLRGWVDREFYQNAAAMSRDARAANQPDPLLVSISWSALYVVGSDPTVLRLFYWGAVVIVALFTAGVATRLTAVLTWVVVVSFTANPALLYDGDALLRLLAFYLMVGYLAYGLLRPGQSLAARLLGPGDTLGLGGRPGPEGPRLSVAANTALRLLQVHFAILVVASGLHKLQFGEWWSGAALWYALYPPLQTTAAQAREHAAHAWTFLGILSVAAYATLVWQLSFPAFAWRPRWRVVLLGGAVLGWLGTALVYDLPLFGPAYLIGCLAFLTAAEWRRALAWLPGLQALARRLPAAGEGQRRAVFLTAGRSQ
jgi:hypothetical protein